MAAFLWYVSECINKVLLKKDNYYFENPKTLNTINIFDTLLSFKWKADHAQENLTADSYSN